MFKNVFSMKRGGWMFFQRLYRPPGYWKDVDNQRKFLEHVIKEEKLQTEEEKQERLTRALVRKYGGLSFINAYPSFYDALSTVYPEVKWKRPESSNTTKTKQQPTLSETKRIEKHRRILDQILEKLHLKKEDLYHCNTSTFLNHGAQGLFRKYPSYMECIQELYPEVDWDPLQFRYKSREFWKKIENQRALMKQLEGQFRIKKPKEWLNMNVAHFRRAGGFNIFKWYPSFLDLLKAVYPDESWESYEQRTPRRFWENKENLKIFLDNFAKKHNIKEAKQWVGVSHLSIKNEPGGSSLLSWYRYSLHRMLKDCYPSLNWTELKKQYKSENKPKPEPLQLDLARQKFDEIGKQLGVKNLRDWYKIPVSSIRVHTNIIRRFPNKLECFKAIYPEYSWNALLFDRVPNRCWQDKNVQKEFFERVKEELGVTTEQLLTVPLKKYYELGGTGLLKANNCRKYELICDVYPQLKEIPELQPRFWESEVNQRAWIEKVAKQLEIQSPEDWSKVSTRLFSELGGNPLLYRYRSMKGILNHLFPDQNWDHLQVHVPHGFWKDHEQQRRFFMEFMKAEGIQSVSQLKDVQRQTITDRGGYGLLKLFPSYYDCLRSVFPEEKWNIFEFATLPRQFWSKKENHRKFLDYVAKEKNIRSPEDWHNITVNDIKQLKGSQLVRRYSSFFDALRENYPEYDWDVFTSRKTVPRNYWKSSENCKAFFESFATAHNIQTPSDWSKITKADIIRFGGSGLLFGTGLRSKLKTFYPDVNWKKVLDTPRVTPGHWNDRNNVIEFIEKFKKKYRIKTASDWVRVSKKQVCEEGGQSLIVKYGGLLPLLQHLYPSETWNEHDIAARDKRSVQRLLFLLLQEIFVGEELVEEFIHDGLTRKLGRAIEFDIYLPKYDVGIEYHGKHHYAEIPSFGQLEMYQTRDFEKKRLCDQHGIKLIVIPCWWENDMNSLKGTLAEALGDQLPKFFPKPHCLPIPQES